jgi:hypothetical protein
MLRDIMPLRRLSRADALKVAEAQAKQLPSGLMADGWSSSTAA